MLFEELRGRYSSFLDCITYELWKGDAREMEEFLGVGVIV
jgi:hypothetical protein